MTHSEVCLAGINKGGGGDKLQVKVICIYRLEHESLALLVLCELNTAQTIRAVWLLVKQNWMDL